MAKILIIDDSSFQRKILREILESESHSVIEASDGEKGLEMIIDQKPDLILLDQAMPGTTGYELLAKIKEKGIRIPTIMVSADIQHGSRQKSLDSGAKAFIEKPVDENILKKLIQEFC
ncbi:MAG: response regulator [bacterium]|nr:MAG: response regulator [bacterium]